MGTDQLDSLRMRVAKVFEQYQKARTQFVQTVADLASRPQNIEPLQSAGPEEIQFLGATHDHIVCVPIGVMQLLRPMLMDAVPTIQQTAAVALGRLANHNDDLAEAVVKGDILPQLVYSLAEQNVSKITSCHSPYSSLCPPLLLPFPYRGSTRRLLHLSLEQ